MPRKGYRKVTREELIRELRWLVQRRRSEVTQRDFARHLQCSHDAIHQHFATWKELRRAAGLISPRAPARRAFSDADLCDEFNRLRKQLGRDPTESDFEQLGRCRYPTLKRRFGSDEALRRRASARAAFVEIIGTALPPESPPRNARSALQMAWKSLRFGYAVNSSDLKHLPADRFDVVVCLKADWPGCPWATVELGRCGPSRAEVADK